MCKNDYVRALRARPVYGATFLDEMEQGCESEKSAGTSPSHRQSFYQFAVSRRRRYARSFFNHG